MQHVHVTCRSEALQAMVQDLRAQFATQPEEVTVLDYGYSQKCAQGYVVLEWIDEADELFLKELDADDKVLDYSVYMIPAADDFAFGAELAVSEQKWDCSAHETN